MMTLARWKVILVLLATILGLLFTLPNLLPANVVAKLPPRHRELVQLLFFEQPPLPYAEVARRLGLATGSIGFIRGRCLERLRKALVEFGFNG